MADRLQIYRGALRLLGRGRLSSLTEVSPDRYMMDDIWTPAVDYLLAQGLWNFSIRTVELSADEDYEPLFGYTYSFSKPTDWVRTANFSADENFSRGLEDYHDEASYWFCNVDTVYLRYVSNDEAYGWNVGEWRQPFSKALEAYMAFEAGLPVSNDKSNRNDMYAIYEKLLKKAKILDAVDEAVQRQPVGRLVRSRGISSDRKIDSNA